MKPGFIPETDDELDELFGPGDSARKAAGPGLELVRSAEDELPDRDELASQQFVAAVYRVHENTSQYPRFPLPSLHDLAGLVAPDELWVLAARQGNGKSLFCQNLTQWLIEQDVPTLYMGTEQDAEVLRIKQACVKMGVRQKLILKPTPEDKATTEYTLAAEAVQEGLKWLDSADVRRLLVYANSRYIDRATLAKWSRGGVKKYGVKCIIVDHIHHMKHGQGYNAVSELTESVHLAKDLACEMHVSMLVASQVKRPSGDAIKRYTPPDAEDLGGSSALERTADVALGIWRPLRTDLPVEELRKLQQGAKLGSQSEDRLYQEHAMGVRVLKDRLGDAPGKQCFLRVEKSRVLEIPERDRYTTRPGQPGQP